MAVQKQNFNHYQLRFTLLGDPALKLPLRVIAGVTSDEIPDKFMLEQNYPNPFNPTTVINYSLPIDSHVSLEIYDIPGNLIKEVVDGYQNAGSHSAEINLSDQA